MFREAISRSRGVGLAAGALVLFACSASAQAPADYVNPLIGTANSGNTFPGAVMPFGMVSFSPEELRRGAQGGIPASGYDYAADTIRGFSLTHLSGAGCGGSGDFVFMPLAGEIKESPALDIRDPAYLSTFQHGNERAAAGYYRVLLQSGVQVELTATPRTGAARFAFPRGAPATLLIRSSDNETISTAAHVSVDAQHRSVSGWLRSGGFCRGGPPSDYDAYYTIYFVAQFSVPFANFGTWKDGEVRPGSSAADGGTAEIGGASRGKGSGAWLVFQPGAVVEMRVGISYVSEANAAANLRAENPPVVSFAAVRTQARAAWNAALGRIAVSGGSEEQKRIFYTALYHSLLHMNLASDRNGEYRGMDQQTHWVMGPQRAEYANFSGWDVYRSQVQLVALLFPDVASDMAQSLLNQADQWGCWSRWTHESGAANVMNGDPSAPAIAAMVAFGADRFQVKRAYESLLKAATVPHEGRRCSRAHLEEWLTRHYLTAHNPRHDSSVSDTLELCAADFALAQLAGREGDPASRQMLLLRSQNWKNLFNHKAAREEGYLQARDAAGNWKPFDPASGDGFVEGSGAQYLWMVPFDPQGLFALLGGDEQANRRLDDFFHDAQGGWAFTAGKLHPGLDNEPSLATPWLYDFSGEPYKTQETVRAILATLWRDAPDGIPGNDDLGEMSSWYVWASMGLYPMIPGSAELAISSPEFREVRIRRAGRPIEIEARPDGPRAVYIRALRVDGKMWQRPLLPGEFVRRGGRLTFDLSYRANTRTERVASGPRTGSAVRAGS